MLVKCQRARGSARTEARELIHRHCTNSIHSGSKLTSAGQRAYGVGVEGAKKDLSTVLFTHTHGKRLIVIYACPFACICTVEDEYRGVSLHIEDDQ